MRRLTAMHVTSKSQISAPLPNISRTSLSLDNPSPSYFYCRPHRYTHSTSLLPRKTLCCSPCTSCYNYSSAVPPPCLAEKQHNNIPEHTQRQQQVRSLLDSHRMRRMTRPSCLWCLCKWLLVISGLWCLLYNIPLGHRTRLC